GPAYHIGLWPQLIHFHQAQRVTAHHLGVYLAAESELAIFLHHPVVRPAGVRRAEACPILKIIVDGLCVLLRTREFLHHILVRGQPDVRTDECDTDHIHDVGPRGMSNVNDKLWKSIRDAVELQRRAVFIWPPQPRLKLRAQGDIDRHLALHAGFVDRIKASIVRSSQSRVLRDRRLYGYAFETRDSQAALDFLQAPIGWLSEIE